MLLKKTSVLFIVAALTLANTVTIAAGEPPTSPSSSITLQPYACRSSDETGDELKSLNSSLAKEHLQRTAVSYRGSPRREAGIRPCKNRIAFKADGSRFIAPMGNGKIGIFSTHSEPEPLNDQDIERYRALAALLDDDDFRKRSMATEALRAMGTPIHPLLEESLRKAGSRELSSRLTVLLYDAPLPIHTVHVEQVLQSLIRSVRYSPNGEYLLVAGYGDSIKLLNARDLQVVRTIPTRGDVNDALFLHKGERLAVGIDDMIQFWSTRTGERLPFSLTHTGGICCLDASPDERWLAVSGGATDVSIWDLETHLRVHLLEESGDRIENAEFSPDGKFLAYACKSGNVSVWDVPTFRRRYTLKRHEGSAYHVAFSPDGHWLASTGDKGEVVIWDPVKGKLLTTIDDRPVEGKRLATNDDRNDYCTPMFSPDSKFLLTMGSDKIRLWRITSASENGQPGATSQ